jgi:uncharacterized Tic20 family protein
MSDAPMAPDHPSEEERLLAALAHGSSIIGFAVIGPLALYLIKKDQSAYVGFHAKQALVGQLVAFAIVMVVSLVTCGMGTILIFPWFVYEAWLAYEAYQGKWTSYPLLESVGKEFG